MRVFIGPLEVAGIAAGWQMALRACGVDADLVLGQTHPFAYTEAVNPQRVQRWWAAASRWFLATPRSRILVKLCAFAARAFCGWLVLLAALRRYDAFIFLFGRTLTDTGLELRVLRWFGKRVVVVFLGSDARPAYIDGAHFPSDSAFDVAQAVSMAARQCRRVQLLERWADVVVNARATAQFHRKPFVNWFALGIPRDGARMPTRPGDGETVILHSPSHPVLKGTAEITRIVESMRARGIAVRLRTIKGRPNAEVMAALRDCDLVADQLYSDTPMAGFAAEAAACGRPAVVGGCAAERVSAQVAPAPVPPSAYVRPEAFAQTLEELVCDGAQRRLLGERAAEFAEREWSLAGVGSRLQSLLRGDIPSQWWCGPDEVEHVVGCGLAEPEVRRRVAAVIQHGGRQALQLCHNAHLEAAFVRFARGEWL